MSRTRRLLRFLLVEIRDWLFAALAIVAAFAIPAATGGNWPLTLSVLAVFLVLYVGALFLSRRLQEE